MQRIVALLIGLTLTAVANIGSTAAAADDEVSSDAKKGVVQKLIQPPRGFKTSADPAAAHSHALQRDEAKANQPQRSKSRKHTAGATMKRTAKASHSRKQHSTRHTASRKSKHHTHRSHRHGASAHKTSKNECGPKATVHRTMARRSTRSQAKRQAQSKDATLASATVIDNGQTVVDEAQANGQTVVGQGYGIPVESEHVVQDGAVLDHSSYAMDGSGPLPEGAVTIENAGGVGGCNQCGSTTSYNVRRVFCRGRSTCNMPPHMPYYPEAHGYYYFRPYNWPRVVTHQNIVPRWGGDWRHPYANEVFDRVYARLGIKKRSSRKTGHDLRPVPPEAIPSSPSSDEPVRPSFDDDSQQPTNEGAVPESDSLDSAPVQRGSSLPRLNDAVEAAPSRIQQGTASRKQPEWEKLESELLGDDQAEAELVNFVKRRNRARRHSR